MRILVVEDVGFVRHNLERLLTQHNHSVVSALSGEKALETLKSDHKIDVVITGLFMSGIGGIDLFKEAQLIQCIDDSGRPTGPDFILTTTTERTSADSKKTAMVQQALDIGFVDVLLKPIDSAQMIARLRQIEMSRSVGGENGRQNSESAGSDFSGTPGSSTTTVAHDYQIQMLQEIKNSLPDANGNLNPDKSAQRNPRYDRILANIQSLQIVTSICLNNEWKSCSMTIVALEDISIECLTNRQQKILKLLALGNSVKEAARKLHLAPESAEGHKHRIMKKLGIHDRVLLARYAIRNGLILP